MLNSERKNSQSRRPELHLTIVVKRATTTAPQVMDVEIKEHH
jgi:hypothetical protein